MDEYSIWFKILGGTGGVSIIAWAVRTVIRRLSRDQVEVAKDRAEIDVITTLREQLKEARENERRAIQERNEAMIKLGGLQREVELLREHIDMLNTQATDLRTRVEEMVQQQRRV